MRPLTYTPNFTPVLGLGLCLQLALGKSHMDSIKDIAWDTGRDSVAKCVVLKYSQAR